MVRVPLPFRGVAVLLLVASTALGQTPEPPAEFSLDSIGPSSTDLLRQFSTEIHNPLLTLMVDGELTSFDAAPPKEATKIKPTPQSKSASSATTESDSCPAEIECPTAPCALPFACYPPPPPQQQCHCRKCQRKHSHGHRGGCGYGQGQGYGGGYGNPYLNWPSCPAWCFYGAPLVPCEGGCGHRRHQKHGCGHGGCANQGYGSPYGYGCWAGWNAMGGDGCLDEGCCGGCMPFMAPPPQQQCHCHKCQRKHGHGNSGYGGYPYGGGYGGGWGMGYGGFMGEGWCGDCMPYMAPPPPQQQCHCRKCQRKHHGSSNEYGYGGGYGYGGCGSGGCGYPGWAGDGEGQGGCGKQRHGLFHHSRHCQQPPPYPGYGYPMMMSCMGGEPFCSDCAFGSDF